MLFDLKSNTNSSTEKPAQRIISVGFFLILIFLSWLHADVFSNIVTQMTFNIGSQITVDTT